MKITSSRIIALTIVLFLIANMGLAATASEDSDSRYENVPEFGGTSSVGVQLKDDADDRSQFSGFKQALKSYNDFKERLNKEHGFAFSFDYTAMYLNVNKSLTENNAAGGILRFYGSWTLLGRDSGNTGSLVYKIENRHKLGTDIPPRARICFRLCRLLCTDLCRLWLRPDQSLLATKVQEMSV